MKRVWIVTQSYRERVSVEGTDEKVLHVGTLMKAFGTAKTASAYVVSTARLLPSYDWENASDRARRAGEEEYACARLGAVLNELTVEG